METKNWFIHVEWVVVLVTLLGGFYMLDGKIERQGERTDQLYAMWCDTQKEIKEIKISNAQMWVETQKEIKDLYIEILKEKNEKPLHS